MLLTELTDNLPRPESELDEVQALHDDLTGVRADHFLAAANRVDAGELGALSLRASEVAQTLEELEEAKATLIAHDVPTDRLDARIDEIAKGHKGVQVAQAAGQLAFVRTRFWLPGRSGEAPIIDADVPPPLDIQAERTGAEPLALERDEDGRVFGTFDGITIKLGDTTSDSLPKRLAALVTFSKATVGEELATSTLKANMERLTGLEVEPSAGMGSIKRMTTLLKPEGKPGFATHNGRLSRGSGYTVDRAIEIIDDGNVMADLLPGLESADNAAAAPGQGSDAGEGSGEAVELLEYEQRAVEVMEEALEAMRAGRELTPTLPIVYVNKIIGKARVRAARKQGLITSDGGLPVPLDETLTVILSIRETTKGDFDDKDKVARIKELSKGTVDRWLEEAVTESDD